MTILDLLKLNERTKYLGVWLSGLIYEGEFKSWHGNGQLWEHYFYKNGELHGEYVRWWSNGKLASHCYYEKGIVIKEDTIENS